MNIAIRLLPILVALLLLMGCTASRLVVAPNVDLKSYKYVVISKTSESSSAVMFGLEVEVGNLFVKYGYTIIGDKEAVKKSEDEQKLIMIVRGAMTSVPEESICTIVLDDFSTGRTLVTARGSYGMGMTMDGDREGAMRDAMRQVEKLINTARSSAQ